MDDTMDSPIPDGPAEGRDAAAAVTARPGRGPASLAGRLPALKLPGVLGALRSRWHRPQWHRPHLDRPSLPDLVLAVGSASLVISVLIVLTGPARQSLNSRSREAAVVANAATLQLAAETYAAANLGRYPDDVLELLPYLPAGDAPRNPFTGARTLFRGAVGDLTYRPGTGGGYVIEAWGPGVGQPRRLAALKGRSSTIAH